MLRLVTGLAEQDPAEQQAHGERADDEQRYAITEDEVR